MNTPISNQFPAVRLKMQLSNTKKKLKFHIENVQDLLIDFSFVKKIQQLWEIIYNVFFKRT